MPLHTDYRPTTLDEIVGNTSTVQALKAHLEKKSPNRAMLFVGGSGMGKTTLAMCVARQVIGGDDKAFGYNFTMLNTSDFRGIDTVRDIRESACRKPLGHACARVWLMDECHKLTPDAQEALLKLLEDPPRDCWFLLATTNPEKLKVTLKRRATEYSVSPVTDRELSMLLTKVVRAERKRVPNDILQQIIKDSIGSCGIALNVLDKVIDLPTEQMAEAAKQWAARASNIVFLGKTLFDLYRSKAKGKDVWEKTLCPILKQFDDEDAESLRRSMLEYFRKVFVGGDQSVYALMICFTQPYYDTGKAGLAMSVYEAFCAE